MSKLNLKLLMLFLLLPIFGFGQKLDVKVTLTVDKDTVNIGDIVHLESRVEYDKLLTITGEGLQALPENEYLEFRTDPISSKDDILGQDGQLLKRILKHEVDAIVFLDSGWISVPPLVYQVVMNDSTYTFQSDTVKLFVKPIVKKEDIPQGLRTIMKEPKSWKDYWPWFVGMAVLALAVGLFYFLRKREVAPKEKEIILVPTIPPGEEALSALKSLYESQLWMDQPKELQMKLSQILRQYIEREYRVSALEETTREIEKDLRRVSPHQRAMLVRLLNDSDMVKFAKMIMPIDRHQQSIKEAILWVKSNTNG